MKFDIHSLATTVSTNDDAKLAAESGAADGLVIWALQQSSGKGRQGRIWSSPAGNLYFSVLLRPACAVKDYGKFSFVAALAVYEAVDYYAKRSVPENKAIELKWPNDVLVNGKKISGVLLEAGEGWLVIGIGLNVQSLPDNPHYPATSLLAETGETMVLRDILDKILESLAAWRVRLHAEGFAGVRSAWLAHAKTGAIRARLPQGEVSGQFAGMDNEGNLQLVLADGSSVIINSGDIFF